MDNDLISRAAIIREIERIRKSTKTLTGIDFLWMIETFPAVDAVPIRHGYWIDRDGQYECNECHNISCCRANYCPDCGSMMIGGEQNATDRR